MAYKSIRQLSSTSAALRQIIDAPFIHPSGLRSLLSEDSNSSGEKLVIVRGTVNVRGNDTMIVAQESGDKCVIYRRAQSFIYVSWRGLNRYGWMNGLSSIMRSTACHKQHVSWVKMVPFVLTDSEGSDHVVVSMEGSEHPLPLKSMYYQLQPIPASPFSVLQAIIGLDVSVAMSDEEKIVPLGRDITAVGICSLRDGIPVIKSCKHLPCFLSNLTKDEIVARLATKTKWLKWCGIFFGSVAVCILAYSVASKWIRWRERRQQQLANQQNDAARNEIVDEVAPDEEDGDIPMEQLCVICSVRRRHCAFLPCGHLVSCRHCAISVRREEAPQCPVCTQSIGSLVRIYVS